MYYPYLCGSKFRFNGLVSLFMLVIEKPLIRQGFFFFTTEPSPSRIPAFCFAHFVY